MSVTISGLLVKCAGGLAAFAIGIAMQFAKYDGALSVQPDSAVRAISTFVGVVPLCIIVG